ncbi:MAG: hypothetical protein AB1589_07440 [Cyanobacteriota bacterium]
MSEIYEVQPSDILLRWLHPGQFKWDEGRATSAAFRDEEMSVDILCLTTLEESYARAKKINKNAIASLKAQFVLEKGLKVIHSPIEGNYAHAIVLGKKSGSILKFLVKNSKIEIYPPS